MEARDTLRLLHGKLKRLHGMAWHGMEGRTIGMPGKILSHQIYIWLKPYACLSCILMMSCVMRSSL